MSKIYRTAAENLTVAWNVIPHVTQHHRADITDLETRGRSSPDGIGKNGPVGDDDRHRHEGPGPLPAGVSQVQQQPRSRDVRDRLQAVNQHRLRGRHAERAARPGREGSRQEVDPADRQRLDGSRRQGPREEAADRRHAGATCTVTNLGGIGGVGFTPIVNYLEVCIPGMSRGQSELKLVDGKVVERLMLPLSLSYDHRVINGADAAWFLVTLCNMLADPFQLLAAC